MKRTYTDEQFIEAVKNNFSVRAVLTALGLAEAGGSYKLFYKRIQDLNLDISHFNGKNHLKGKHHSWGNKIPLEQILIKNSAYLVTSALRKRLIKENILENKCASEKCGINEWHGEPLSLHLDHIDGDNSNNELDNLRLLCPNCHSQTITYCGRNKKSHREKIIYYCKSCNTKLAQKRKTEQCFSCLKNSSKFDK